MATEGGVRTKHPDYLAMQDRWSRARDVISGRDAIIAAGEKYLPKLKDQDRRSYEAYLTRGSWYNATARSVEGFVGMIFRKPPTLKDVPEAAQTLLDSDADGGGEPFDLLAKEYVDELMQVGRVGLLVDFPPPVAAAPGAEVTVAQAQAAGQRPSLCMYHTESIINWRYEKRGGVTVLALVVLTEAFATQKTEFQQTIETRYRVLDLGGPGGCYRQRVFRINTKDEDEQVGDDVIPTMNGQPMPFIPFVIDDDVDVPPLMDLIDLNLDHWRVSVDYERGCHITAIPTPWVAGWSPATDKNGRPTQTLYIGSDAAWVFSDPNAKAGFLEFTGAGLNELRENMNSKESRMAILGARMLEVQKRDAEAADTAAIHRSGEGSVLATASAEASLQLTQAVKWFCTWAGSDAPNAIVELNKDFLPAGIDALTLQALVQAWQAGAISWQTLFERLQAGEVISDEVTAEEEQARIGEHTPPSLVPPGATTDPTTGAPRAPSKKPGETKP